MSWTAEDIPDQTGRTAIVTGANSGIGFETARALAAKGARVILACRNERKAEAAISRIRKAHPDAQVDFGSLDLGDLASIREFSARVVEDLDCVDLLINNAGVMAPPFGKTADGFELQFGTNHLGHFALTGLLLPLILSANKARVVSISSLAHRSGKIDFANLNAEVKYAPWTAYGQSKLANLLFTHELQRRFSDAGKNTIAVASHPGWTATDLQRNSGLARFLNPIFAQGIAAGATPTLFAAVERGVLGGEYFGPEGFMEMRGGPTIVGSTRRSRNLDTAAKLWKISEEKTGVEYSLLSSRT